MNYKLIDIGVTRLDDRANIPADPNNRDWQEYQKWLVDGNTPLPADSLPLPTSSPDRNLKSALAGVVTLPDLITALNDWLIAKE